MESKSESIEKFIPYDQALENPKYSTFLKTIFPCVKKIIGIIDNGRKSKEHKVVYICLVCEQEGNVQFKSILKYIKDYKGMPYKCSDCTRRGPRKGTDPVIERIEKHENEGYLLSNVEKVNERNHYTFKCIKCKRSFDISSLSKFKTCPNCREAKDYLQRLDAVKLKIKNTGCELLLFVDKFKNQDTEAKFRCPCGRTFQKTIRAFEKCPRCPTCVLYHININIFQVARVSEKMQEILFQQFGRLSYLVSAGYFNLISKQYYPLFPMQNPENFNLALDNCFESIAVTNKNNQTLECKGYELLTYYYYLSLFQKDNETLHDVDPLSHEMYQSSTIVYNTWRNQSRTYQPFLICDNIILEVKSDISFEKDLDTLQTYKWKRCLELGYEIHILVIDQKGDCLHHFNVMLHGTRIWLKDSNYLITMSVH